MLMKRVLQWLTCQLDVLQVAPHSTRDEGRYQGPREGMTGACWRRTEHERDTTSCRALSPPGPPTPPQGSNLVWKLDNM